MVLASLAFCAMAVFVKLASASHHAVEIMFWRGLLGALAIAAWALPRGGAFVGERFPAHLTRSAVGTASLLCWYWSLGFLPLATAMTLNYTSPLFIAAILVGGAAMGRGRVEAPLAAALLVGFGGIVLLLRPSFAADDVLPATVGLIGGAVSALAYLQVRKLGQAGEPGWRIVFWFCAMQVVLGAVAMIAHIGMRLPNAHNAGLLVAVAGSALIGQVCMTRAFSRGKTLLAANLQYLGVVFAAIAGWWLLDERIDRSALAGMAVILASGAAATALTARQGSKARADAAGQAS